MLISQRIQSNPNFLTSIVKKPLISVAEVKTKILNSIKILIGNDLMEFDKWAEIPNERIHGKKLSNDQLHEKKELYLQFGRLPYPLMFVENETGGLLIERRRLSDADTMAALAHRLSTGSNEQYDTMITLINKNGLIEPARFLIRTDSCKDYPSDFYSSLPTNTNVYVNLSELMQYSSIIDMGKPASEMTQDEDEIWQQQFNQYLLGMAGIFGMLLFEILLFMNATNTELVSYKASKNELKNIPKVLHPKYEYKILDIYRTKKQYVNMDDVLVSINRPEHERQVRRAHLVRGHFCTRGDKLYWRRPHMRNRKNLEDVGFVDKDYSLVNE